MNKTTDVNNVTVLPSSPSWLRDNTTDNVTYPWNPTTTTSNYTFDWTGFTPRKYMVKIFVKVPKGKAEKPYFDKAWMKYTGGSPETERQFWDYFGGKNNVLVFFFKSNKEDIQIQVVS